jgi:hypothetical protein
VEDTVREESTKNRKGRGRGRPSPKNGKGRGRGSLPDFFFKTLLTPASSTRKSQDASLEGVGTQYGRSLPTKNRKGRGRGRPSPKNGKGRGRGSLPDFFPNFAQTSPNPHVSAQTSPNLRMCHRPFHIDRGTVANVFRTFSEHVRTSHNTIPPLPALDPLLLIIFFFQDSAHSSIEHKEKSQDHLREVEDTVREESTKKRKR